MESRPWTRVNTDHDRGAKLQSSIKWRPSGHCGPVSRARPRAGRYTVTPSLANALAIERTHVSTVKEVFPDSVGNIALSFDTESSFCGNANSPKQYFIAPGADGVTVEASKNMLAVALLAFSMGAQLTITFKDGTTYCYINRLYITRPAHIPVPMATNADRLNLSPSLRRERDLGTTFDSSSRCDGYAEAKIGGTCIAGQGKPHALRAAGRRPCPL